MIKTVLGVAVAAALLTACGPKTADTDKAAGPAVAASETPRNDAVDTTPTTGDPGPSPGANSFTEAQAKSAIEFGRLFCRRPLTQDANGLWMGKATKGGTETTVSVDYKGAVTAS